MSDNDEHLTRLLNRLAPPARDPLFRVQLMERKERERFRRSVVQLVSVLVVGLVAAGVGMTVGGGSNEMARFIALGIGVGAGVMVYALALKQLFRRF
jgi:hypothetical protein